MEVKFNEISRTDDGNFSSFPDKGVTLHFYEKKKLWRTAKTDIWIMV